MEKKPKPVEVIPEKSEKPLKEDLSCEDKEEKIGEEIKVENETEPGNRKFMWRQFTLHMIKCTFITVYTTIIYRVYKKMNKSEIALRLCKAPQCTKFSIEIGC